MKDRNFLLGFAAAGILLFFLYLPGLAGPFLYDDNATILYNAKIQSDSLFTVLTEDPFRALPNLTFAAQYRLAFDPTAGQPRPRPFHLVNLFLHWLNGLALSGVLLRLRPRETRWAFGAAILFLFHPLLTETVNFVTARFSLMATLGCLLAVAFYLDSETQPKKSPAFWAAWAAALLCKEIAATLPAVLWALNRARGRRQRLVLPALAVSAVYLGLRLSWTIILAKNPEEALGPFAYFLAQNRVLWLYAARFLWPVHLTFDYQLAYATAGLIPFVLANAVIGGAALLALRRGSLAAAGLLSGVILFLPTSSVIPLADLAKEYHAYLPAAALIPLGAAAFFTSGHQRKKLVAFAALLLFCAGLTFSRNLDWQNEERLWRDAVTHSPTKHRSVYNYAQTLRRQLKLEQALFYYRRALALKPHDQPTLDNIEKMREAIASPDRKKWEEELQRRKESGRNSR